MESSGKGYKNHAATIRRWANADKKKEELPARNRDYSVEEGARATKAAAKEIVRKNNKIRLYEKENL